MSKAKSLFPQPSSVNLAGQYMVSGGLSTRELFAAMAMQGLCVSDEAVYDETGESHELQIAKLAVKHADALLKALEEAPDETPHE